MTEVANAMTLIWEGDRAVFAKAFIKAQQSTEAVKKAASNPHFKTKYADLSEVVEATVPALNAAGIGVMQAPAFDGEMVSIETILMHESGSSVTGILRLRPSKLDPQGVGSAITYGRRYSLLAMTGAAPEDDDGQAASGPRDRQPQGPSAAAAFAADWMTRCKDKAEFSEYWNTNKDGLKKQLSADDYAYVVKVMQEEAKRFAAPAEQSDETPFDKAA